VAEDLLTFWAEGDSRRRVVNFRFFNLYGGIDTNPHFIPAVIGQLDTGAIRLGNVTTRRDYVHVDDVASLVARAVHDAGAPGLNTYNVGTGQSHTGAEVVQLLSASLGRPIEVTYDASRSRSVDRPELRADIAKVEAEFGFAPRSLAAGLGEMVKG
jgi:nucleoside-diphosphate-sugar epimerase